MKIRLVMKSAVVLVAAKQHLAILICVLICLPFAFAQDPQTAAKVGPEVTVIIERQQVRFSPRGAVEQMQLQVFDRTGELVFNSGPVSAGEINWPFQNGNGDAITSGLYAYALSVKEQGQETARVRRGHFIVDRAKDRDGNADKLWVTSQGEGGVGAELTVAKDENVTVASAVMARERTIETRSKASERGDGSRQRGIEDQRQPSAINAATVPGGWLREGNIVMLESSDSLVGVGTSDPQARLHLTTAFNGLGLLHSSTLGRRIPPVSIGTYGGFDAWGADGGKLGTISNHPMHFFAGNGRPSMTILPGGFTGIGTFEPRARLHVNGGVRLENDGRVLSFQTGTEIDLTSNTSSIAIHSFGPVDHNHVVLNPNFGNGNVGVGLFGPRHKLSIAGGPTWTSNGWRGAVELEHAAAIAWNANSDSHRFGIGHTDGGFYFFRTSSDPGNTQTAADYLMNIGDTGVVSLRELQITSGADFAENFEVSEAPQLAAGMVVSIDAAHPGDLKLSRQAYDRRVAGVISGAGGVKPGMVMGQQGTVADGKHPVALSGRVYVWADAAYGAIKPGDLLTTSATPGHAMKSQRSSRAQGAIIGKAMTGLKSGKGLVLVLVTLQ